MLWIVLWLSEWEASLYTCVFLGRCRCLNGETHFHVLQPHGWLRELKTFIFYGIVQVSKWKPVFVLLDYVDVWVEDLCAWSRIVRLSENFSLCCWIVWVSELKTGLRVPGVCRCAWKACLHVLGLWMWMKDLSSCSKSVWLCLEDLSSCSRGVWLWMEDLSSCSRSVWLCLEDLSSCSRIV